MDRIAWQMLVADRAKLFGPQVNLEPALRALAWGRLPLQVPLVAWALAVRRRT